jgi:hypothetical protein
MSRRQKSRYPANWPAMALDVKMRAKFRCKQCGRQFEEGDKNIQVHHWDYCPENNDYANLICLCGACHLEKHKRQKGNVSAGQMSLFDVNKFSTNNSTVNKESARQLSLFDIPSSACPPRQPQLKMSKKSLLNWKKRVFEYQDKIRKQPPQPTLFEMAREQVKPDDINPFELKLHSSLFWRMPDNSGPADETNRGFLYFVIDNALPIILYIGETKLSANQRWSGVHDCKSYIMNYIQQHRNHELDCQVCTAFFPHLPPKKNILREWERELILKWHSPFNQQMWHIYAQPFGKQL